MKKQSLWQVVFEFLSIVFAVLLALGLNSYKQNQDLKAESEVLSNKILSECQKNLSNLDTVLTQNKEFMIYLDSLRELKDEVDGFGLDFSNDLLSSSAWKFTQASHSFQLMDQEFLDDATELYEIQSFYMEISNDMFRNLGEVILRADDLKTRTMISTLHYYLRNIVNVADDLKENYEDFIAKYQDLATE
ncbi:MAG: hypothetical protein ABJP45_08870 [Cyclobacteriaceae bacterium]